MQERIGRLSRARKKRRYRKFYENYSGKITDPGRVMDATWDFSLYCTINVQQPFGNRYGCLVLPRRLFNPFADRYKKAQP
jgi:hypothetical protein